MVVNHLEPKLNSPLIVRLSLRTDACAVSVGLFVCHGEHRSLELAQQ